MEEEFNRHSAKFAIDGNAFSNTILPSNHHVWNWSMNEWFENRLIEEIVNQQYFATATNYAKQ